MVTELIRTKQPLRDIADFHKGGLYRPTVALRIFKNGFHTLYFQFTGKNN